MTAPGALPRPGGHRTHRFRARIAVLLARPIAMLSPRTLRRVLAIVRSGAPAASYAQAKAARDAVCAASLACSAPHGCLRRSLATAILCRINGVWPTWCSGVRAAPPFGAHAWIEADGELVDEGVPRDYFRRLLVIGSASESPLSLR